MIHMPIMTINNLMRTEKNCSYKLPDRVSVMLSMWGQIWLPRKEVLNCQKNIRLFPAAGVHPSDVSQLDADDRNFHRLRQYCRDEKCVAVGEIGLDYYWDKETAVRERQKYWFRRQLALAKEVGLPIIVHSRDAAKDTLDIIKSEDGQGTRGVIHCFSIPKKWRKVCRAWLLYWPWRCCHFFQCEKRKGCGGGCAY